MLTTAISVTFSLISIQENEVTKKLAACAGRRAHADRGRLRHEFSKHAGIELWGYPLTLNVMDGIAIYLFFRFRRARWL